MVTNEQSTMNRTKVRVLKSICGSDGTLQPQHNFSICSRFQDDDQRNWLDAYNAKGSLSSVHNSFFLLSATDAATAMP